MFSRPKILFLVSLLFVALLNPKFNPYLPFKFLIFYHSSIYTFEALNKYTMLKLRMVWCFNERKSFLPLKISRIQYTTTLVPTVILDNIY